MLPDDSNTDRRLGRSLLTSLVCSTTLIDDIASRMYRDQYLWSPGVLDHTFSLPRTPCRVPSEGSTIVGVARTWLRTHEEAQIMLASILVVVGLWWLVRAVLSLLINLVCPLLVVILAVVIITYSQQRKLIKCSKELSNQTSSS